MILTLKNIVTRFEYPNSVVQLRDNTMTKTKHWYKKEQDRWKTTNPPRFLITLMDSGSRQTALCEVEEPCHMNVYRPIVLSREVIDALDRGRLVEVVSEIAERDSI